MKKLQLTLFIFIASVYVALAQTSFYTRLADSTLTLTKQAVRYDPNG